MTEDLSGLAAAPETDTGSLESHEAAFGPNGTGEEVESAPPAAETSSGPDGSVAPASTERDEAGRFQKTPRHRAKSQQAGPADVPRIQELTAKLRAAEAERDAARAEAAAKYQAVSAEREARPAPQPQQAQSAPAPSTRPEPSEDEIGDKYATYGAYAKDLALWTYEQERAKDQARAAQDKQQKTYRDWTEKYSTKRAEFVAATPDFDAVTNAADAGVRNAGLVVPQVLVDALLSSDRGPEVAYWLAQHPQDYHELIRDAWSVNAFSSVGMVRRVLESRLTPVASAQRSPSNSAPEAAGITGAAPRLTVVPAPRPPTPVRTGPLKSGDEPPDETDGLEAHESYFHKAKAR